MARSVHGEDSEKFIQILKEKRELENFKRHILRGSKFIQVNTSEYGDSRIMKPSKSVEKNMVVVKGGKNSTILIDDLDIDSLR